MKKKILACGLALLLGLSVCGCRYETPEVPFRITKDNGAPFYNEGLRIRIYDGYTSSYEIVENADGSYDINLHLQK